VLDTDSVEPIFLRWLESYDDALAAHWPVPPQTIEQLRRISQAVWFEAPETRYATMREVWRVYRIEGDTDVGRAAVMLTYIIAATVKPRAGK
jgi:hypothetical protein